MKKGLIIPVGFLLFYLLFVKIVIGGNENKIIFLNLRCENNSITLNNVKTRTGKLKIKKSKYINSNVIVYEIYSSSHQKIGEGNFKNPLYTRYEYGSSEKHGDIKSYQQKLDVANFTLRIPFREDIDMVAFYNGTINIKKDDNKIKSNIIKFENIGNIYISNYIKW